jgi:hypothetical protein
MHGGSEGNVTNDESKKHGLHMGNEIKYKAAYTVSFAVERTAGR